MNTQSISWTTETPGTTASQSLTRVKPTVLLGRLIRLSLALTVALSMVIAITWMAMTPTLMPILGASMWGIGFVFLAMTLDSGLSIKRALPLVTTGVGLPVLGLMGSHISEGFLVIAGTLVAGWLFSWLAGPR